MYTPNELMSGLCDPRPMQQHQSTENGYKGMLVVRSELKKYVSHPSVNGVAYIGIIALRQFDWSFLSTQELHNGVQDVAHCKKNLIMSLQMKFKKQLAVKT